MKTHVVGWYNCRSRPRFPRRLESRTSTRRYLKPRRLASATCALTLLVVKGRPAGRTTNGFPRTCPPTIGNRTVPSASVS